MFPLKNTLGLCYTFYMYILIRFYFSGFETRIMTVSCPKDLSVGHLNVYHLANKVTDVNVFVHQSDILHIFGVSESRLTSYVSDEVVSIPNYSILRRDADEPGHTGIAVYVYNSNRDFTHRRYDLESTYVESVWLQVKTRRGPPFLIAFIYRSSLVHFGLV